MTRIVTTRYRYKRPPRKRKAVALEVPVIVARGLFVAAILLVFSQVVGCASIAAYEASHPRYTFPRGGGGGGGNGG